MYKEFKQGAIEKRVNLMINYRAQFEAAGVEKLSVKFSFGNRKTGAAAGSGCFGLKAGETVLFAAH